MISNTIYSKGQDRFKGCRFSAREWSAPTMISPKEVKDRINSFALCGRKIRRMRMIGLSYFHTRDWVEAAAYRQVEHLPEAERQRKSNYLTISPNMYFNRCAEIDEPFLIAFEDGDVFEIDTPQESECRMSMNCIPWWIKAGTNQPNIDADILFSLCIGQAIVAVDVNTYLTDKDPMFREAFDKPPYRRELISDITLRLENGVSLQIGACIDYCVVACVDANNAPVKISFSELKRALFNWEDLHNDEATGFESESWTLFFGRKGAEHTENPYITLSSSGNKESYLHISVSDFLIMDWCISLFIEDWFDKYGEYHFNCTQWHELLDEASRLLSIKSFDTLFDELVERQGKGNDMINKLNIYGVSFWKDRKMYQTQIEDLRKWSALVLGSNDTMDIYGL